jgi:hypothetical protein
MKQQVRQRAGEAVIKRQQRPQFNRKDFIQQMKGRKEQGQQQGPGQDGPKALRTEDRPKGPFEQDRMDKNSEGFRPLRSGDKPFKQESPGQMQGQEQGEFRPLRSGDRPPGQQFQDDRPGQQEAWDVKPVGGIKNIDNENKRLQQSGPPAGQKNIQQGPGSGVNAQGNQPKPKIPVAPPRIRGSGTGRGSG